MKLNKSFNKTDNPIMAWRVSQNLSRKSLAEALGTSEQVVESWEKNESSPRDKYLHRLAAVMEVSFDDLRNKIPKNTKNNNVIGITQDPGQEI